MNPAYHRAWRRDHFESVRKSNRKYWARNAKRIAEARKAKRGENYKYGRSTCSRERMNEISREYRKRKKLRLAWLNWTRTLAASRHV